MTKNIIITSTITSIILTILLPGACIPAFLPALVFAPIIGGIAALRFRVIQSKRTKDFSASIPLWFGVVSGIIAAMMALTISLWFSC